MIRPPGALRAHFLHAPTLASPNRALVAFVRSYLETSPGGLRVRTARIAVASIPNNDIVVYVIGDDWCGTGGCHMLVVKRAARTFTVLGYETIVHPPIRVLNSRTHGEPDIGVTVCGGGVLPCYEAVLSYDGSKYPLNPSMPPARPLRTPRGRAVISGDAFSSKGSTPLYHQLTKRK
jgi:hypothetical protein